MMNSPGSAANIKTDAKFRVHTAINLLFCFLQEVVRWNELQLQKKIVIWLKNCWVRVGEHYECLQVTIL